jgi:BMFP domain-containing protein YqiC
MRRKKNKNMIDNIDGTGIGGEGGVWDAAAGQPHDFFPNEAAHEIRAMSNDLRERISKLETQMMAQYTAMAAYATIAENAIDGLRAELRSDIDRSQSTTIGLVERVRRECADSITGIQVRTGNGDGSDGARLDALENRFESLAAALQASIEAQGTLAEQITILLEEKMHREGWLVANGSDDLTLH